MRRQTCMCAGVLAAATWMAGCRSCGAPDLDASAPDGVPGNAVAGHPAGEQDARMAVPSFVVEASVVERSGQVEVARSEATRMMPGVAELPDSLFVGDSVSTGADGSATLDVGQATTVVMGPSTRVSIGVHRPLEVILHVGMATISGEAMRGFARRFTIVTPGGLIFYSGPSMNVAVARTGETRVDVTDCPRAEAPASAQPPEPGDLPRARCSLLVDEDEIDLVTGDHVLVGADLAVRRLKPGEVVDAGEWMAGRAESLKNDPGPFVGAFAGWIGKALADMREHVDGIKERRERNKVLIKTLRDLRKQGKPDPSQSIAEKAPEGAGGEIAGVKAELTTNSSEQYKLRHRLMARWGEASLTMTLLGPHLTAESLAPAGKTPEELTAAIEGLGVEFLELFSRKSRQLRAPKFMPKNIYERGALDSAPKKRVEKL
jgi:hypothetical protein